MSTGGAPVVNDELRGPGRSGRICGVGFRTAAGRFEQPWIFHAAWPGLPLVPGIRLGNQIPWGQLR